MRGPWSHLTTIFLGAMGGAAGALIVVYALLSPLLELIR